MESLSVNIQTSKVHVGLSIPKLLVKGRLFNGEDSFYWIYNRRELIGWTYSYNPKCSLLQRFKRFIAGCGRPQTNVRIASNCHVKCYIDKKSMLIGSFNLTEPTIQDLCVEVTDRDLVAFMTLQFRKHWKQLR